LWGAADGVFALQSERNGTTARELDGVGDEVEKDLGETNLVACNPTGDSVADAEAEMDPLAGRGGGYQLQGLLGDRFQAEGPGLEFELAGIDFRIVEDVVDDGEQVFSAGADDADELFLFAAHFRGLEQGGHPDDAVHGSADLVAHVGEEFAFQAGGGGKLVGGIGEFQIEGHDALVGDFQFLVGVLEPLILLLQHEEHLHQFPILAQEGLARVLNGLLGADGGHFHNAAGGKVLGSGGQLVADDDAGSFAGVRFDGEIGCDAAHAGEAFPEPGAGFVIAGEDHVEIIYARAGVRDGGAQFAVAGRTFDEESGCAAACVAIGVTHQFGDSGCETGLIDGFELQVGSEFPRP
jgi:hypothetical protein